MPASIGRYRIEARLGGGAMGIVFRAHDPEIDRRVAIKLVHADLLAGEDRNEYMQRFRREAQAAGRCVHPNIVALYDVALHEGQPFLVMEYVEGTSLNRLLASGSRPAPRDVVRWAQQILDALACAHGLGIVHRDIKPANLLLNLDGRVKITDFGISRLVSSDMTEVGTVLGTPSYMSPEQCRGEEVGPASDLFSLASVLHELLTGRKAFAGNSVAEITYKILREEADGREGVPPPLQAVLLRAHAKRAGDRYRGAAEMSAALRGTALADADTTLALESRTTQQNPELAHGLEVTLARYVGPIASHLVRQAMRSAESPERVGEILARSVEDPSQRQAFLREIAGNISRTARSRALSGAGETIPPSGISAEEIARVTRDLSHIIGPIAGVLVKRARASSVWELRVQLASHIANEKERKRFLAG